MSRSRGSSDTHIGLFAFLDVLMVTMGSLILLLIVVTPKIRQESVAKAAAAKLQQDQEEARRLAARPLPPPVPVVDEVEIQRAKQLQTLSAEADSRKQAAEQARARLMATEQRTGQAARELKTFESRLSEVRRAAEAKSKLTAKLEAEKNAIEAKQVEAAARLRRLRGQVAETSTKYTFVAYDGVSGTTRRPILVECTKEHIKFLQEGVSMTAEDVAGFTPSFNPLLSGALALTDYWSTHANPGEPRPYVLLVVRPSGSIAYSMARHMLERMKEPFGYELLEDEQKLEIPPPVPEAADACRRAVEKTIASRGAILEAVRGRRGNGAGLFPGGPEDSSVGGLFPADRRRGGRGGPGEGAAGSGGHGSGGAAGPPEGSEPLVSGSGNAANGANEMPAVGGALEGGPARGRQSGAADANFVERIPAELGSGSERKGSVPPPQIIADGSSVDDGRPSNGARRHSAGGKSSDDFQSSANGSEASDGDSGASDDALPNLQRRLGRKRWGLSSPHASIGYEKNVKVNVEAQRILVGEQAPIPCGNGESSSILVSRVIAALEREARNWGPPPENFYWVPSIKFVISPGGNLHYERIRTGVMRHGLIGSVDYRLDAPDPLPKSRKILE